MIPGPVSPALRIAFWMAFSALFFGMLMGIVRHLGQDLNILVISFWRFVFSMLMFVPWFMRVGPAGARSSRLGTHIIRSLFLIASSITLLSAVLLMPLDEVTALSFTSPLFATIAAIVFLRERAGPRRWAALLVGFLGILVILRPGAEIFNWAAFLVLFSSLTFAGVLIYGKILLRTDSPALVVAYLAVISVPLSFLPALIQWQWPSGEQFLWLIVLGICANGNMYGIAKALEAGETSATQPYDFLRLPTTALVGWLFFHETSDQWTWIGALIIFGSTFYITRREALKEKGKERERSGASG